MISTVTLLRALADGPMRSDSLLRRFDGIDLAQLVLTLRSLEGRGLVERRMERVYGLTAAGRGLLRALGQRRVGAAGEAERVARPPAAGLRGVACTRRRTRPAS